MRSRFYYGDGSTYASMDSAPIGSDRPIVLPPECPCCGAVRKHWTEPARVAAFFAPNLNVQILKQEANNERGFSQRHGCNFFTLEKVIRSDGGPVDSWRWGGKNDVFGLQDYYGYHIGPQKVVVGREIHDDIYHEISRRVVADGPFGDHRE